MSGEGVRAQARRVVTELPSEVFTDGDGEYFTANVEDAVNVVAPLLAELEKLRELRKSHLEINQGWVDYRERTKARRREFLDTIAKLTRERVALRAQLEARRDQLDSGLGFANEAQLVHTLLELLQPEQPGGAS